ncbi:MAG: hypothetical protein ACLRFI_03900 [Alphaproteobacteria bacterium]
MHNFKKSLIDCIVFYTDFINNHPEQKIHIWGAKASIHNAKTVIKICDTIQKLKDKQRNR